MQVVRYFHIYPEFSRKTFSKSLTQRHKKRGCTIKVTGDTEHIGQVDVQVAFCSKKDEFCKRVGRAEADKAPVKVVALRYLPNELAKIEEMVYGYALENKSDFLYALRYFLPKE